MNKIDHYVVYENPSDFPGKFVVRIHTISEVGRFFGEANAFSSLDEARKSVPPGLVKFRRSPMDDPRIVETWL